MTTLILFFCCSSIVSLSLSLSFRITTSSSIEFPPLELLFILHLNLTSRLNLDHLFNCHRLTNTQKKGDSTRGITLKLSLSPQNFNTPLAPLLFSQNLIREAFELSTLKGLSKTICDHLIRGTERHL